MSEDKNVVGLGFLPILTLVFITLKLCGVLSWSWFWVLSPTLIPLGIIAAMLLFVGIAAAIGTYQGK